MDARVHNAISSFRCRSRFAAVASARSSVARPCEGRLASFDRVFCCAGIGGGRFLRVLTGLVHRNRVYSSVACLRRRLARGRCRWKSPCLEPESRGAAIAMTAALPLGVNGFVTTVITGILSFRTTDIALRSTVVEKPVQTALHHSPAPEEWRVSSAVRRTRYPSRPFPPALHLVTLVDHNPSQRSRVDVSAPVHVGCSGAHTTALR